MVLSPPLFLGRVREGSPDRAESEIAGAFNLEWTAPTYPHFHRQPKGKNIGNYRY